MVDRDDEGRLMDVLKETYRPATASPEFKERLRKRLLDAGRSQPEPRPLWFRPLVWAPVAAAIAVGLIAYFAIIPLVSHTTYARGSLEIWVTDAPGEVTSVNVTISEIQVHRADDDTSDDDGWITVISDNRTFDLIALRDVQELLGEKELEVGHYTQIRLSVDNVTVDGVDAEVKPPSGELKLVGQFDIEADCTTALTLDFDALSSVDGPTAGGKIVFQPVVKLIIGEPCGDIDGSD